MKGIIAVFVIVIVVGWMVAVMLMLSPESEALDRAECERNNGVWVARDYTGTSYECILRP